MMKWPHSTHMYFDGSDNYDTDSSEKKSCMWAPCVIDLSLIHTYYLNPGDDGGTYVILKTGNTFLLKEQFDKFRVLITALHAAD